MFITSKVTSQLGRRAAPLVLRKGERISPQHRNPIAAAYLPTFLLPPCDDESALAIAYPQLAELLSSDFSEHTRSPCSAGDGPPL